MSFTAAAAAIGSAAAGIGSALLNNAASVKAVKKQIEWERERATHAHQWEVSDLKKAGLNPILSAGGQGATTGGISAPVPDTSGIVTGTQSFMDAINTALKGKEVQNQTKLSNAEIHQKDVLNELTQMQTLTESYKQGLISKQTASTAMETNLKNAQLKAIEQDIQQKRDSFELKLGQMQAAIDEMKANKRHKEADALIREYEATHRRFVFWKNQTMDIIGALGQAKRDFFGTKTKSETYNVSENFDAKGRSRGRKESHTISNMNKLALGLSAARLMGAIL